MSQPDLPRTEHPAIVAWKELRPDDAAQLAVEPVDAAASPERVHRVVGGNRCGAVIAKRVPASTANAEWRVYESLSRRLPEAIPRYFGGVHDDAGSWIFTEELSGAAFREHARADRQVLAAWLARLHAAAECASELRTLPSRGADYYRHRLGGIRAVLEGQLNHVSCHERRRVLASSLLSCERLSDRWGPLERTAGAGRCTLVHGDLVAHNVFVNTSSTGVSAVAIDWEKAGWGSPAEDLSNVDLHAYTRAISELGAAPLHDDIEALALAGRFFRCVVFLDWVVLRLDREPQATSDDLALCNRWLSDLTERAPW